MPSALCGFAVPSFICVILVAFYPVGIRKKGLEEVTAKLLKQIEEYAERGW